MPKTKTKISKVRYIRLLATLEMHYCYMFANNLLSILVILFAKVVHLKVWLLSTPWSTYLTQLTP